MTNTDRPRLLGLDYGTKRIGVAGSDVLGIAAHAVDVIALQGTDPASQAAAIKAIAEIATEREATVAVVGLPKNMNDTEGTSAQRARAFADALARATDLAVVLWDERLTSTQAEAALRQQGLSHKKRKQKVDAVAAQILLQSYMEAGWPKLDTAITKASLEAAEEAASECDDEAAGAANGEQANGNENT